MKTIRSRKWLPSSLFFAPLLLFVLGLGPVQISKGADEVGVTTISFDLRGRVLTRSAKEDSVVDVTSDGLVVVKLTGIPAADRAEYHVGFDSVSILNLEGCTNSQISFDVAKDSSLVAKLHAGKPKAALVAYLLLTKDKAQVAKQMVKVAGIPESAGDTKDKAAEVLQSPIRPSDSICHRNGNDITLVFQGNGALVGTDFSFLKSISDRDRFFIYFWGTKKDADTTSIRVEGNLGNDQPSILGLEGLAVLKSIPIGATQSTEVEPKASQPPAALSFVGMFGPYSPPAVTIHVSKGSKETRIYTFKVTPTYSVGIRLGVLSSNIGFNDFQVRRVPSLDTTAVVNLGDTTNASRYYLSVIFYEWDLMGITTPTRNFAEKSKFHLFPYVGLGLKDVGKEFFVGLSLEIARGLALDGGLHVARVDELGAGVKLGDSTSGTAADLPIQHRTRYKAAFGVSVDLGVIARMLGAL
ncbi:MAG: hypothetical protein WAU88_01565 [Candidatus Zixiibacteriota bacterium]